MTENSQNKFGNSYTPPPSTCPTISVIIPMYNAERYIGDCLDSILAQTFQSFEVIVVDDCSTDSSCTVVESYFERFDGRLTLTHTEENSGQGSFPRNRGLIISRGEYVYFVDNDDLLTKTALEEAYTLAKDYDADVVYSAFYCNATDDLSKITPSKKNVTKSDPALEPESVPERIQNFMRSKYEMPPWVKFVRRRLLVENKIFFPRCAISEDDIWTFGLLFYAKKFLRVSNTFYIRRNSKSSISRKGKTALQTINFWLSPILIALKHLDELMARNEFFKRNPQQRYAVLEMFTNWKFNTILPASLNVPPFVVYEAIKQEFGKNFGEHDVLICALSAVLNSTQKNLLQMQQQFQKFVEHTQAQYKQFNQFAAQAKTQNEQFRQFVEHTQAQYKRFDQFAAQAQAREKQFRQFVEHTQAQYKRFNQFAAQAQARIAYLEAELQKRQT